MSHLRVADPDDRFQRRTPGIRNPPAKLRLIWRSTQPAARARKHRRAITTSTSRSANTHAAGLAHVGLVALGTGTNRPPHWRSCTPAPGRLDPGRSPTGRPTGPPPRTTFPYRAASWPTPATSSWPPAPCSSCGTTSRSLSTSEPGPVRTGSTVRRLWQRQRHHQRRPLAVARQQLLPPLPLRMLGLPGIADLIEDAVRQVSPTTTCPSTTTTATQPSTS